MRSATLSTLSVAVSAAYVTSNRSVAVYKGLKVAVYTVDKTELSLARTDLIELINVRILLTNFFLYLAMHCSYQVMQPVAAQLHSFRRHPNSIISMNSLINQSFNCSSI